MPKELFSCGMFMQIVPISVLVRRFPDSGDCGPSPFLDLFARGTLSARSRRLQTRSRHGAYLFLPLHLSLLSDPFTFRSPTLSPWDFALFSAERRDRPSAANNSAFRCAVYFSLAATISPLSGRHAGCDRGAGGPADLPAPL